MPATSVPSSATVTALLVASIASMGNGGIESLEFFSANIALATEVLCYEDVHDRLLVSGIGILDDSLVLGAKAGEQLGQ